MLLIRGRTKLEEANFVSPLQTSPGVISGEQWIVCGQLIHWNSIFNVMGTGGSEQNNMQKVRIYVTSAAGATEKIFLKFGT